MSRANIGTKLRTLETWRRYQDKRSDTSRGCFMCTPADDPIVTYCHWMIIENEYPYDAGAEGHTLLVPMNHVQYESPLTIEEMRELEDIIGDLEYAGYYDCIVRNFTSGQSFPIHLHYHLIKWIRSGQ